MNFPVSANGADADVINSHSSSIPWLALRRANRLWLYNLNQELKEDVRF